MAAASPASILGLASVVEQRGDEPLGQFGGRERAGAVVFRGLGSPPGMPSHGRDGVAACRNEVKALARAATTVPNDIGWVFDLFSSCA